MASLLTSARAWVDRIHLNRSIRGERAGRLVLLKRRRSMACLVMRFANVFFRWARNPVEVITGLTEWQRWEAAWFRRLHGPDFAAGTDTDGTHWLELLPGKSLSHHLSAGTLRPAHLAAAGAELRRAHAFPCAFHGGRWSHGDSHTGNFIFDSATGRARLVDFEVRHLRRFPEDERHADDLLVMLQDLCGRCPDEAWLPLAGAFLEGYDRPEIVALVPEKLRVPGGIPRLWWAVRTTWMPRIELECRLSALAGAISRSRGREEAGTLSVA
jgi:tRNA A-37 threonylcarbamoyl transferase component Bud32